MPAGKTFVQIAVRFYYNLYLHFCEDVPLGFTYGNAPTALVTVLCVCKVSGRVQQRFGNTSICISRNSKIVFLLPVRYRNNFYNKIIYRYNPRKAGYTTSYRLSEKYLTKAGMRAERLFPRNCLTNAYSTLKKILGAFISHV